MKLIKKIITIGAIVLLSACAEMQSSEQQVESKPAATKSVTSTDAKAAKAAIAAAVKARKAASKVGYEWRHTAKTIKQAKSAAKKKNYQKAIMLANKAKKEGEDALAQYHTQKGAGMSN